MLLIFCHYLIVFNFQHWTWVNYGRLAFVKWILNIKSHSSIVFLEHLNMLNMFKIEAFFCHAASEIFFVWLYSDKLWCLIFLLIIQYSGDSPLNQYFMLLIHVSRVYIIFFIFRTLLCGVQPTCIYSLFVVVDIEIW